MGPIPAQPTKKLKRRIKKNEENDLCSQLFGLFVFPDSDVS
jgi:hypothetical protein